MDGITRQDVMALASAAPKPGISIYLPTDRTGIASEGDRLRLKNLLAQAAVALQADGMRAPDSQRLLKQASELVSDAHFWAKQSDGLAIFISSEGLKLLRLPLHFTESVSCGPRFITRPLLPLVAGNEAYFLLAASENEVRLLFGSRDALDEIDLPQGPASQAWANRFETHEGYLGFHGGAPQGAGRFSAQFYGMGSKADESKGDMDEYARQIAAALDDLLDTEDAPLVIAATEALAGRLRAHLRYGHLWRETVLGSPDHLSAAQLHEQAWPLVRQTFTEAQVQAADEYAAVTKSGRATSGLEETLGSAADGRIAALFVDEHAQVWGRFDLQTRQLLLGDHDTLGGTDLLDLAGALTMQHGGAVYALPAERMPASAPMAALLRY